MNNEEKRKKGFTWRVAVVFLFIFAMGVLFGKLVNFNNINSLEGYQFNLGNIIEKNGLSEATACNATSSNATDCNATSSNATDCNATSSNATACNATSSNATSSNVTEVTGEIYLEKFNLKVSNVYSGDKVYVDILTSGDSLNSASVVLVNNSNGARVESEIKDLNKNPYIIIPLNAALTDYGIESVFLEGKNSSGNTFTKYYTAAGDFGADYFDFGNIKLKVDKKTVGTTGEKVEELKLNTIKLENNVVKVGENLGISLECNQKVVSAKLTFKVTTSNDTLVVYAKSLDSNPYITIPTGTKIAEFKLNSIVVETEKSTKIYSLDTLTSGVEKLTFDVSLKVESNGKKQILEYNNEDITDKILSEISKSQENLITINADGKSIISSSLFNAIKGKDKKLVIKYKGNEIIFNGQDITIIKDLEVSASIYNTSSEEVKETIGNLINSGIVVEYKANGILPGKALVRIKADDTIRKEIGNIIYVYYFNETNNKFELIAENVKISQDNYYEFYITHNSKYVMVKGALDNSLVCEASIQEDVVSFVQGNTTYILLIVLAVVVIVTVVIIIIINKKKHI